MTIDHNLGIISANKSVAWVKPSVRKINAGSAEDAPNPGAPDGPISEGVGS